MWLQGPSNRKIPSSFVYDSSRDAVEQLRQEHFPVRRSRAECSLSSETPLPPPWQDGFCGADEEVTDKVWELQESELDFFAHRSVDHGEIVLVWAVHKSHENVTSLEKIEGFIGAALADCNSNACVDYLGGGGLFDLAAAVAINAEVLRSKRKIMCALGLGDDLEDMLISLGNQYHLIRPVRLHPNLFFYLVLDREHANLAMSRFALADAESALSI